MSGTELNTLSLYFVITYLYELTLSEKLNVEQPDSTNETNLRRKLKIHKNVIDTA